jgi:ABC-type sugar transport system ATPase subunit
MVPTASKGAAGTRAEGPAVSLRGVGKRFGATRALEGIDLDLFAGEVHALVGENGAGKSTCLGLMAGRLSATEGQVEISGQPLQPASPQVARKLGVAAIYQELTIFPDMNALENAFVGAMPSRFGLVNRARARRALRDLLERYGLTIDPTARAGDLSVADLQLVEILRGVYTGASVLLFDEPTASLGTVERHALHRIIRDLKAQGTALAFVSHDLDEVLELSDRITVFRDGRMVASRPTVEWDKAELIKFMLGRSLIEAEMVGAADVLETDLPPRLEISRYRAWSRESASICDPTRSLESPGS